MNLFCTLVVISRNIQSVTMCQLTVCAQLFPRSDFTGSATCSIETFLSILISHILNFRQQKVKLFFRNTISDHNTFSLRRIFVFFFYRSVEPSTRPPLHRVIRGTSLHQPFFWLIERFVNPLQCKLSTQTKVRLSN